MVLAARFGLAEDEIVDSHLLGVDAASGHQRWSVPLDEFDLMPVHNYPEVKLAGDTVVVRVRGEEEDQLVAYRADTGQERWRTSDFPAGLRDAAHLDDTLLLNTTWHVAAVDLATGEARVFFEGEGVGRIMVDDTTIALRASVAAINMYAIYPRN